MSTRKTSSLVLRVVMPSWQGLFLSSYGLTDQDAVTPQTTLT